ncbi:hypothetical protein VTK26DRAFT_3384 [Humicola hyalothermophila]
MDQDGTMTPQVSALFARRLVSYLLPSGNPFSTEQGFDGPEKCHNTGQTSTRAHGPFIITNSTRPGGQKDLIQRR